MNITHIVSMAYLGECSPYKRKFQQLKKICKVVFFIPSPLFCRRLTHNLLPNSCISINQGHKVPVSLHGSFFGKTGAGYLFLRYRQHEYYEHQMDGFLTIQYRFCVYIWIQNLRCWIYGARSSCNSTIKVACYGAECLAISVDW